MNVCKRLIWPLLRAHLVLHPATTWLLVCLPALLLGLWSAPVSSALLALSILPPHLYRRHCILLHPTTTSWRWSLLLPLYNTALLLFPGTLDYSQPSLVRILRITDDHQLRKWIQKKKKTFCKLLSSYWVQFPLSLVLLLPTPVLKLCHCTPTLRVTQPPRKELTSQVRSLYLSSFVANSYNVCMIGIDCYCTCTAMMSRLQEALRTLQAEGAISPSDYVVSAGFVCNVVFLCVCTLNLDFIFSLFRYTVLWKLAYSLQRWPAQGLPYSKWWSVHLSTTVGFFKATHLLSFNASVKFLFTFVRFASVKQPFPELMINVHPYCWFCL